MFSNEEASRLIKLPKKDIDGAISTIDMNAEKNRLTLRSVDEPEYEFLFEITSHRKISFKISFHSQEHNTKEGLIRVDYKGGHQNPDTVTEFVPDSVKPYKGYFFQNEPHIHIYVQGFKHLAWAIPLSVYNFPILEINNIDNFKTAIYAFAKEINIISFSPTIQTVAL